MSVATVWPTCARTTEGASTTGSSGSGVGVGCGVTVAVGVGMGVLVGAGVGVGKAVGVGRGSSPGDAGAVACGCSPGVGGGSDTSPVTTPSSTSGLRSPSARMSKPPPLSPEQAAETSATPRKHAAVNGRDRQRGERSRRSDGRPTRWRDKSTPSRYGKRQRPGRRPRHPVVRRSRERRPPVVRTGRTRCGARPRAGRPGPRSSPPRAP